MQIGTEHVRIGENCRSSNLKKVWRNTERQTITYTISSAGCKQRWI